MSELSFADVLGYLPRYQDYLVKTAQDAAAAKGFLQNLKGRSAVAIIMSLRVLYGASCLDWEPETLWLTLEKDGVLLERGERNKVQAALTLLKNPAFYWDNIVFQHTVSALHEGEVDPDAPVEPAIPEMCWAVREAAALRRIDDTPEIPEFDEDVQMFVAVCLRREGMVQAPDELDFCAEILDSLYPKENAALRGDVKTAFSSLSSQDLQLVEYAETPVGVQLAKLAACAVYVREKTAALYRDLTELTASSC